MSPLFHPREESDCRPLDQRALAEIIDRVDSWYDAVFPSLVMNGPGGSKGHRKRAKQ